MCYRKRLVIYILILSAITKLISYVYINLYMMIFQIEILQEQLRDKEKQMSSLRERVKSLQTDTSNTDTVLSTLEDSLAEKVTVCVVKNQIYIVHTWSI